ncbi:MAG: DUF3891 family protein [bacterium]|nr:DUF3891 family protein [bacterium]
MIVRPMSGKTRLITQHDHARVAGTLARRWVLDELIESPAMEFREEFYFAVDNHDVGWCKPDAKVQLDLRTGCPLSFFGVMVEEMVGIWTEGIRFCALRSSLAGYLVSAHFSSLAESGLQGAPPDDLQRLQKFLEHEKNRQKELSPQLAERAARWKDSAALLLRTCDTLSLLICRAPEIMPSVGQIHPLMKSGLSVRAVEEDILEVRPWPFGGDRLDVKYPGMDIAGVSFGGDKAIEEAITGSDPAIYVCCLRPLAL